MIRSDWRRIQRDEAAAARKSAATGQGDKVLQEKEPAEAAALRLQAREDRPMHRGKPLKRKLSEREQALATKKPVEAERKAERDLPLCLRDETASAIKPNGRSEMKICSHLFRVGRLKRCPRSDAKKITNSFLGSEGANISPTRKHPHSAPNPLGTSTRRA